MGLGRALEKFRRGARLNINKAAYNACRHASVRVVNDLKSRGPYYAGDFESAWEVRPGSVNIPADRQPTSREKSSLSSYAPREAVTPIDISEVPNQRVTYRSVPSLTIGNRMVYRDVALDLETGRLSPENPDGGSAPQDWYLTYYAGGGLDNAVAEAAKTQLRLPAD